MSEVEIYVRNKAHELVEEKRRRFKAIFSDLMPSSKEKDKRHLVDMDTFLTVECNLAKAVKEDGDDWSNAPYKSDMLCHLARIILWTYNRSHDEIGTGYIKQIKKDLLNNMMEYAQSNEAQTITVSGTNLKINE